MVTLEQITDYRFTDLFNIQRLGLLNDCRVPRIRVSSANAPISSVSSSRHRVFGLPSLVCFRTTGRICRERCSRKRCSLPEHCIFSPFIRRVRTGIK